jgi:hypothetical protein
MLNAVRLLLLLLFSCPVTVTVVGFSSVCQIIAVAGVELLAIKLSPLLILVVPSCWIIAVADAEPPAIVGLLLLQLFSCPRCQVVTVAVVWASPICQIIAVAGAELLAVNLALIEEGRAPSKSPH